MKYVLTYECFTLFLQLLLHFLNLFDRDYCLKTYQSSSFMTNPFKSYKVSKYSRRDTFEEDEDLSRKLLLRALKLRNENS